MVCNCHIIWREGRERERERERERGGGALVLLLPEILAYNFNLYK